MNRVLQAIYPGGRQSDVWILKNEAPTSQAGAC